MVWKKLEAGDVAFKSKDFPIFKKDNNDKPFVYFDTAATAQKPKGVIDALTDFYMYDYATVHRSIYSISLRATERYNKVRRKVASFINAKEDEIIFVKGTTEGLNLLSYTLEGMINEGDEIIISELEHHSNIVPWQMLCQKKKAKLKIIPINDKAELELDVLYNELVTANTKLICITHMANITGTIVPIKEIASFAKKRGIKVVVDGAQAIAHLPVDVVDLGVDFYIFSAHKLYGPNGVGILFGKRELLNNMSPFHGGGGMIDKVELYSSTYQNPPLRFEAGTPVVPEIVAFGEVIDYLEKIGRENIFQYEKELFSYAINKIKKIKEVKIIGDAKEKGSIISFIVDNIHALDLATLLDLEGICVRSGHHCAQLTLKKFNIPSTVRVSFGIYNTHEEVDYFVKVLNEIIKQIKE